MWLATLGVAALLLMTVAIVNGGPIVFPDSIAYLIDGDRMAHLVAPYAVRPVFYGAAMWVLHRGTWFWGALFVQALIVAHLLWLALRSLGTPPRPGGFLLLVLALVLLTPVAWHVAHLLPDIFVAALVLALFLLGTAALGSIERFYLVLLAAASISFHLTALPLALALLAASVVGWWVDRRIRPGLVLLPLLLAIVGSLAFNLVVWHRVTLTPNSPPALLARVLADGPGLDFLRARCPAEPFALCRYLDRLPTTEDGFLWEMLPALPVADGKQIKAEAGAVVAGTVRMFPVAVAGHMLANAARQAVTIRSETQEPAADWAQFQHDDGPLARATADTLQARGWFERPRLDIVNAIQAGVAGLSLVAAIVLLVRGRGVALLLTVLLALATNAFITGALSGVFGRYEGRMIWLLPFAVLAVIGAAPPPWPPRTGSRTGSTPR